MNIDNIIVLQVIFDVAVVLYILVNKYFDSKEKKSSIKLIESLKSLLEAQKNVISSSNEMVLKQQKKLNMIIDDVKKKDMLLTELLTTIKNKTYGESLKDRILNMKKEGIPIDEIAKELKMNKGEVELIVKLYREGSVEKG